MPAGELHIQLAVTFANNPKVRKLRRFGRDARAIRDLYVQMLLYCKESLTDGFVPDDQIGILVYPDNEENGIKDAERLAEVGLVEHAPDGWFVTGWFDRNQSKAKVQEKSAAKARGAKLANHRRWHVEHGYYDARCEWCQSSNQNTDQTTDRSSDQTADQSSDQATESDRIGLVKRSDSTETESETESEKEVKPLGRPKPAGRARDTIGSDDDPDFAAFWSAYPRKEAKGAARTAWRKAIITKKIDPKDIILAAERWRDDPHRRSQPRKYTAHPATWLNGERWLEWGEDAPGDDRDHPDGQDDDSFWDAQ